MFAQFSPRMTPSDPLPFPARVLQFVVRGVMLLSALVIAAVLLSVALVWLVFGVLKALVTGRKPAPWAAFEQYRRYTAQRVWPKSAQGDEAAPQPARRHALNDVEDVQVVRETPRSHNEPR